MWKLIRKSLCDILDLFEDCSFLKFWYAGSSHEWPWESHLLIRCWLTARLFNFVEDDLTMFWYSCHQSIPGCNTSILHVIERHIFIAIQWCGLLQVIFVVNTSQGRRSCNELWSMSTGAIMQLPMSAIERVWISPLQSLSDSLRWQSGQSCMWLDSSWVCFPFVTNCF